MDRINKMGDFGKCKDYQDDDMDYHYEPYTGRVYDQTYIMGPVMGGACTRCNSEMCSDHIVSSCPDMSNLHKPWCVSNNSVTPFLAKMHIKTEDYINQINHMHLINHFGDEIAKTNKKLYDMMAIEQPDKIQDPDSVKAFKQKHEFATKMLPKAIKNGFDKALECVNPWEDIFWA